MTDDNRKEATTPKREIKPRKDVALALALKHLRKIAGTTNHAAVNEATLAIKEVEQILDEKQVEHYKLREKELYEAAQVPVS